MSPKSYLNFTPSKGKVKVVQFNIVKKWKFSTLTFSEATRQRRRATEISSFSATTTCKNETRIRHSKHGTVEINLKKIYFLITNIVRLKIQTSCRLLVRFCFHIIYIYIEEKTYNQNRITKIK